MTPTINNPNTLLDFTPPVIDPKTGIPQKGVRTTIQHEDIDPATRPVKKIRKCRVLVGCHVTQEEFGKVDAQGNRRNVIYTYRGRGPKDPPDYNGDIFETDEDICAQHNQPGLPPKFAWVDDHYTQMVNVNPLVKLPTETTQQYAARLMQLAQQATDLAASSNSPNSPQHQTAAQAAQMAVTASQPSPNFNQHPSTVASLKEKLGNMNFKAVQEFADNEEIDLRGAKSKEEAIKVILAHNDSISKR